MDGWRGGREGSIRVAVTGTKEGIIEEYVEWEKVRKE